jgi:hypothetical protein
VLVKKPMDSIDMDVVVLAIVDMSIMVAIGWGVEWELINALRRSLDFGVLVWR